MGEKLPAERKRSRYWFGAAPIERRKARRISSALLNPQAAAFQIGSLIFPQIDQADFTAPFEVLSRIPNSTTTSSPRRENPCETRVD